VLGATCVGEPPQSGGDVFAVVGRVLDADGNPLAGARVLADNGGSYQVIKEWTEIPWRNWVPDPVSAGSVGPYTRRAKSPTGDDGRFRVDAVPAPAGAGWVVVVHVPPGASKLLRVVEGGTLTSTVTPPMRRAPMPSPTSSA